VTTTGQPTLESSADESDYLDLLAPHANRLPELPAEGPLTAGDLYRHGGNVLIVRQDHDRTQFDPSETPALFLVQNQSQDWVAGESVSVGTRRLWGGIWYQARQRHVTQDGWEPPNVPALWTEVASEPTVEAWSAGGGTGTAGSYNLGDEVTHPNAQDNGNVWLFRSKIDANTTEPGTDGAFHRWWEPVEPL